MEKRKYPDFFQSDSVEVYPEFFPINQVEIEGIVHTSQGKRLIFRAGNIISKTCTAVKFTEEETGIVAQFRCNWGCLTPGREKILPGDYPAEFESGRNSKLEKLSVEYPFENDNFTVRG